MTLFDTLWKNSEYHKVISKMIISSKVPHYQTCLTLFSTLNTSQNVTEYNYLIARGFIINVLQYGNLFDLIIHPSKEPVLCQNS